GHVDHGKTSLLDAMRDASVVDGEAGGITQHIGAYQVTVGDNRKITFLDTPGHAAFTQMRARGAQVTDIVIIVVAADDSVKPQTEEAIAHAKAAGVPIIIAINKIDKPDADPNKVRTDLLSYELQVESMGGEIQDVEVSALKKMNLDGLQEAILLQSELMELKANPDRAADGSVVEARLDKGRGPVATVLVSRGTLKRGDVIVAGSEWGKVRATINDKGQTITEAGPALPVEILGLNGVPEPGEQFVVVENEARAREVAEFRQRQKREKSVAKSSGTSLETMMAQLQDAEIKEMPLVIKGDVQGSVEAIVSSLEKLSTDEVRVRVLHTGVGGVSESDVILAGASGAPVIGFNVRANKDARNTAERDQVEIRYYSVIYDLIDDVKAVLSGMLEPELRETFIGNAEILEIFNISKHGKVAGCRVTEGNVKRGAKVRLIRDSVVIHEG
ncbi:MAG: translation initiation factor IF-2, partial [Pseudomonadota bacterium]